MFDTPVSDSDARQTLAAAIETERLANLVDARRLDEAAHWADLHSAVDRGSCLEGTEQLIQFGGDGTPAVAEFAPAEFGAVIGVSYASACIMVGDALDLRHRLPQLWARLQAGEIKCWAARRIAQTTRHLTPEACVQVDRVIAPFADRRSAGDLVKVAEAEAIRFDPGAARDRAEAAKSSRGVFVSPDADSGLMEIFIRADAGDATRFDESVDNVAADLKLLGDVSSKDERRARAIGVLARPQLALDLRFQAAAVDAGAPVPAIKPSTGGFSTTLYVHLTDTTLASSDGVARVEGIGPVLADQVKGWLGHDRVMVKPVIDLPNMGSIDAYESP